MFGSVTRLEALYGASNVPVVRIRTNSSVAKLAGVTAKQKRSRPAASCKFPICAPKQSFPGVSSSSSAPSSACKRKVGGVTTSSACKSKKGLVGSVSESEAAHKSRHPDPLPGCARCTWIRWRLGWKQKQGSYCSKGERTQWVAERAVILSLIHI